MLVFNMNTGAQIVVWLLVHGSGLELHDAEQCACHAVHTTSPLSRAKRFRSQIYLPTLAAAHPMCRHDASVSLYRMLASHSSSAGCPHSRGASRFQVEIQRQCGPFKKRHGRSPVAAVTRRASLRHSNCNSCAYRYPRSELCLASSWCPASRAQSGAAAPGQLRPPFPASEALLLQAKQSLQLLIT